MTGALLLNSRNGEFMSETHRHIASIVRDYDPTLKIVFVPPELRAHNESQPFAMVHEPGDKPAYIVRRLSHDDLNVSLLADLFMNDTVKTDVRARLEALHKAQEALKLKKTIAENEEANDLAASIIGSPLNTYRHNGVKYQ